MANLNSPRDGSRIPAILGKDTSSGLAKPIHAILAGATEGLAVAIIDGSGAQITSFGGGTQYVDAAVAATHPTGTGIIFNNAGTYNFVATAQPLPITIISGNPTTIAATQSGTWTVGLSTGTNILGKVGIDQTTPGTTNGVSLQLDTTSGWTPNYQSALSSTKVQIKGTGGKFGGYLNLYNPNTVATYIQVWNLASASVTVGSTAPTFVITLPGIATASGTGTDRNLEVTMGIAMGTGITIAATTTASGSTAPSNAIVGTFLYI